MNRSVKLVLLSSLMMLFSACSSIPYNTTPAQVEDRTIPPDTDVVEEPIITTDQTTITDKAYAEKAEPAAPTTTITPRTVAPAVKQSPAVIALLTSAEQQQQSGDYQSAQNTLQRAQRIAPSDPQVYYALATTHKQLETYALAEQVALKGVSLVQGQPSELKRFWTLIADIRRLKGNSQGAAQAKAMAEKY